MTSDGTTLLGADDKAGIAEIMAAVAYLARHPERVRAPLRVAFTVDEEVGRGAEDFDLDAFGADVAYTLDGSGLGELEIETFSAKSVRVTIRGHTPIAVVGYPALPGTFVRFGLPAPGEPRVIVESVEYARKLVDHSKHSPWFGASIVPGRDLVELRRRSEAFRALPEVGAVDSILDALPAPGSEARIPILRQVAAKLPRPHSQRFPAVDPAAIDAVLAELLDEVQAWMDAVLLRPDAGEALPALERLEAAIHDVRKAHAEAGDRARAGYEAFESDFFPWIDELVAEGIRPMLRVESVSLERLPAFYRTVFVSKDGSSYCLHVHPEHDPNVPGNRATYVQKCRAVDPEFTGAPVVFHHVSGLMLDGFQSATGYALLVIVVVVALSSSHWIDAPLSLIPIAVGLLWLLGAMAVFDIPFNLANFFGVPILIGAGVDAGVHLVHRFREGGPVEAAWRETGKGIFTANLSNVIGFGAMLVAGHRGIFGLGLLVSIGLTMELLAALIVLPAVLRLIEPRY